KIARQPGSTARLSRGRYEVEGTVQPRDPLLDVLVSNGGVAEDQGRLPRPPQKIGQPAVDPDAEPRGTLHDSARLMGADPAEPEEHMRTGGRSRPGHRPRI